MPETPPTSAATETPAVILRRASERMRELAQAATSGPWVGHRIGLMGGRVGVVVSQPHGAFVMVDRDNEARTEDAAHLAAWHPAVALAVADWLDVTARDTGTSSLAYHAALAVARVFLGEAESA